MDQYVGGAYNRQMKIQNWYLIVGRKVHMKYFQEYVKLSEKLDGLEPRSENT
jgi:hypothetical protein